MGLSFRKSFKVGKNSRINLSKTGGIGFSTGVKGARVSVNKRGARATLGKNGVQYRKDISLNNNYKNSNSIDINNTQTPTGIIGLIVTILKLLAAIAQLAFYVGILYFIFKIIF